MAKPHQAIALARRLLQSLGDGTAKGSPRLSTYVRSWLTQKVGTVAPATLAFYRCQAAAVATARLGKIAIGEISRHDITEWLQCLAKDRTARTANHALKWLRMVMRTAEGDELIARNPATRVKRLKEDASTRRAFTLDELQRLIATADEEWQSLIHFGLYTGQRLGDLCRLTWSQIDLERGEVRMVTAKTGRLQILPLAPPLADFLLARSVPHSGAVPLHPRAYRLVMKEGRTGHVSRQFYELMGAAGLVPRRRHRAGSTRRRMMSPICFHSLRHTATSMMKNAGVSDALVMEFIGHESSEMSQIYTHVETKALRAAADVMPTITAPHDDGQLDLFPVEPKERRHAEHK